uniref:Cell wall protein n=1 Tax=Davidia involucrata TaxID=16924 RepID=A0A5B7AL18_DAVIN
MAHNPHSILACFFIFNILLAIAGHAVVAGRDIPTDSKNTDKKQPEWFIEHDGSVLIPGFGRVMIPKVHKGSSFNPFTYNPVTGTSGGGTGSGSIGGGGGSIGSGDGGSPNYVPGGDDTFVPNPGFEVPIPGSGGGVPAAARP